MIFDFIHVGLYIIIAFFSMLYVVFVADIMGKNEIPMNLVCAIIFGLIIAFLLYVVTSI